MSEVIDEKEQLLIEFLLSDKDLFIKCSGVLQPEYFEDPLDDVMRFVLKYYRKYHNVPDTSVVKAETGVKLKTHEITKDEVEYVTDEIEKHCQQSAMRLAILDGADVLSDSDDPDFGKISNMVRDALMVSIDKDLGTNYFADPAIRLMRMQQTIDARSIGWVSMDQITEKVKRGEMFVFAGNSGSGKSVVLANIANNMAKDGLNVVVISLELDENLISKRIDSIVTNIENKEIFNQMEDVVDKIKQAESTYGSLVIKRIASGTPSNLIRAYLTEYEIQYGFKPDVICVDYLDLIGTNEKVQGNAFDVDKVKSEELREIFQDYNAYGFTASQLNRDAVDTERKSQAHIAGGISKINTADVVMAIIRNEEQRDNGEIHFQLMKMRNAEFSHQPLVLYWDDKTLRITEKKQKGSVTSDKHSATSKKLNDILNKGKKK